MGKGITTSILIFFVAVALVAIVVMSNNLTNGTSISEVSGGTAVGCTDNDGGANVYVKGTCRDRFATYSDYCSSASLIEYSCGKGGKCAASSATCPSGYICSNGACVIACTDECTPSDSKQCSGNGYQTCGNYDIDSCLEWSSVTSCPSGYTCSNGVCAIQPFDFSLSLNPVSGSVVRGGSTITTTTVILTSGTTQPVSFSCSNLPANVYCGSFSPASCYPTCSSTLTIITSNTTSASTYGILVTGTSGNKTHGAIYNLTVS